MKLTLPVLPLLLLGLVHTAPAGDPPTPIAPQGETGTGGCHALMTGQECSAHLSQLAMLPPGPERAEYLAQHLRTKREREKLCASAHLGKPVIYYPGARQAALRF